MKPRGAVPLVVLGFAMAAHLAQLAHPEREGDDNARGEGSEAPADPASSEASRTYSDGSSIYSDFDAPEYDDGPDGSEGSDRSYRSDGSDRSPDGPDHLTVTVSVNNSVSCDSDSYYLPVQSLLAYLTATKVLI